MALSEIQYVYGGCIQRSVPICCCFKWNGKLEGIMKIIPYFVTIQLSYLTDASIFCLSGTQTTLIGVIYRNQLERLKLIKIKIFSLFQLQKYKGPEENNPYHLTLISQKTLYYSCP